MSAKARNNLWLALKVLVSVALICGAAFYLLGGTLSESVNDGLNQYLIYDRTVDQLQAERQQLSGQRVRVGGRLIPGSHSIREGTTEHDFSIEGNGTRVAVRYRGLWPDAATDGRELMVEGVLEPDGVVVASRVLARCPSRYKRRVSPD